MTTLTFGATCIWLCRVNMLGNIGRMMLTFLISSTDDLRLIVMRDIIATVNLGDWKRQDMRPNSLPVDNKLTASTVRRQCFEYLVVPVGSSYSKSWRPKG